MINHSCHWAILKIKAGCKVQFADEKGFHSFHHNAFWYTDENGKETRRHYWLDHYLIEMKWHTFKEES